MNSDKKQKASSGPKSDDLHKIGGVGAVNAAYLRKSGIHSVADVARYESLDELHAALENGSGKEIPISRLKNKQGDWLTHAKELDQASKVSGQPADNEDEDKKWDEHAYFNLIFEKRENEDGHLEWQIKGHRQQNGGKDFQTDGINGEWVEWIWDHANLPPDLIPSAKSEPEAAEPSTGTADVLDEPKILIESFELKAAEKTAAERTKQIQAVVQGELSGDLDGGESADSLHAHLALLLIDEENNQSTQVASSTVVLNSGEKSFTNELYFPLPALGRYEAHCLVYLSTAAMSLAHYRGPMLNVVR